MILFVVMEIITDAELLTRINAFLKEHELSRAAFGKATMSDPALVQMLEAGRSLSLKNVNKVLRWMAEYQPPVADQQVAA
jgi:phage-related minor tail protein